MPDLTPEIASEVVQACNATADEAAEAFGRALDMGDAKLAVGERADYDPQSLPDEFTGPGLVVLFTIEDSAALLLIPRVRAFFPIGVPIRMPPAKASWRLWRKNLA